MRWIMLVQAEDSVEERLEKCRRFQQLTIAQHLEWLDEVNRRLPAVNPELANVKKEWWPGARVQVLELPNTRSEHVAGGRAS